MKKFFVVISLVFLLAACQRTAATLEPTTTPLDVDFEIPAGFAPFENQFPLIELQQTKGYLLHCSFDAFEIEYRSIRVGETEIRNWVKCYFRTASHRIDYVNFPIQIIDWDSLTWFDAIAPEKDDRESQNPTRCSSSSSCGFAEIIPREKPIAIHFEATDMPHKYIIGLGFGSQLANEDPSQNFFKSILDNNYTKDFSKFASTGDASYLPKFSEVEHFLFAYDYLADIPK